MIVLIHRRYLCISCVLSLASEEPEVEETPSRRSFSAVAIGALGLGLAGLGGSLAASVQADRNKLFNKICIHLCTIHIIHPYRCPVSGYWRQSSAATEPSVYTFRVVG